MTIEEFEKSKNLLKEEIALAIEKFEASTRCEVSSISLIRFNVFGGDCRKVSVEACIDI